MYSSDDPIGIRDYLSDLYRFLSRAIVDRPECQPNDSLLTTMRHLLVELPSVLLVVSYCSIYLYFHNRLLFHHLGLYSGRSFHSATNFHLDFANSYYRNSTSHSVLRAISFSF